MICVTSDNIDAPWLLFEAGAISKTVGQVLVCPYLFDVEEIDLRGPLAQFQAVRAQKEGTKKLLCTINEVLREQAVESRQLDDQFEMWWPRLESNLKNIPPAMPGVFQKRDQEDILKEILGLVRVLEMRPELDRLLAINEETLQLLRRQASFLATMWNLADASIFEDVAENERLAIFNATELIQSVESKIESTCQELEVLQSEANVNPCDEELSERVNKTRNRLAALETEYRSRLLSALRFRRDTATADLLESILKKRNSAEVKPG